jgi:hypothetical protein
MTRREGSARRTFCAYFRGNQPRRPVVTTKDENQHWCILCRGQLGVRRFTGRDACATERTKERRVVESLSAPMYFRGYQPRRSVVTTKDENSVQLSAINPPGPTRRHPLFILASGAKRSRRFSMGRRREGSASPKSGWYFRGYQPRLPVVTTKDVNNTSVRLKPTKVLFPPCRFPHSRLKYGTGRENDKKRGVGLTNVGRLFSRESATTAGGHQEGSSKGNNQAVSGTTRHARRDLACLVVPDFYIKTAYQGGWDLTKGEGIDSLYTKHKFYRWN